MQFDLDVFGADAEGIVVVVPKLGARDVHLARFVAVLEGDGIVLACLEHVAVGDDGVAFGGRFSGSRSHASGIAVDGLFGDGIDVGLSVGGEAQQVGEFDAAVFTSASGIVRRKRFAQAEVVVFHQGALGVAFVGTGEYEGGGGIGQALIFKMGAVPVLVHHDAAQGVYLVLFGDEGIRDAEGVDLRVGFVGDFEAFLGLLVEGFFHLVFVQRAIFVVVGNGLPVFRLGDGELVFITAACPFGQRIVAFHACDFGPGILGCSALMLLKMDGDDWQVVLDETLGNILPLLGAGDGDVLLAAVGEGASIRQQHGSVVGYYRFARVGNLHVVEAGCIDDGMLACVVFDDLAVFVVLRQVGEDAAFVVGGVDLVFGPLARLVVGEHGCVVGAGFLPQIEVDVGPVTQAILIGVIPMLMEHRLGGGMDGILEVQSLIVLVGGLSVRGIAFGDQFRFVLVAAFGGFAQLLGHGVVDDPAVDVVFRQFLEGIGRFLVDLVNLELGGKGDAFVFGQVGDFHASLGAVRGKGNRFGVFLAFQGKHGIGACFGFGCVRVDPGLVYGDIDRAHTAVGNGIAGDSQHGSGRLVGDHVGVTVRFHIRGFIEGAIFFVGGDNGEVAYRHFADVIIVGGIVGVVFDFHLFPPGFAFIEGDGLFGFGGALAPVEDRNGYGVAMSFVAIVSPLLVHHDVVMRAFSICVGNDYSIEAVASLQEPIFIVGRPVLFLVFGV